jgi:hypothetical protein
MKMKILLWTFLLTYLSITSQVFAMSPKEIMAKVDKIATESTQSSIQKTTLSTCKFGKKGKKIACVEKPQVKVLEGVQKDTGDKLKDSKAISIILQPIGEKGIAMLSYEYDDPDEDTETWLYFSEENKVRKIVSGDSDDEDAKKQSFFGTEFTVEDMESPNIDEYTYKIMKETTYQKRPVWIIEAVPTAKRVRKSEYSKTYSWIEKERFITLKVLAYNRRGAKFKTITMSGYQQINNVWTAKRVIVKNLLSNRLTEMKLSDVTFNIEIPDAFLTKRTLTDFAFRERELAKLRQYLKK